MNERKPLLEHLRAKAHSAYSGLSHDPEKRAESIVSEYSTELESDLSAIPDGEKARYIKNYTEYLSAWLHSLSNTYSTMIAGPSNFPVARMEKLNRSADNKFSAFREWRTRALKAIAKTVERNKTPQQKNDERWLQIRNKMSSSAATVIAIDKGEERGYARPLFVNSIVGVIKTLAKEGNVYLLNNALNLVSEFNTRGPKPVISDKHSIWRLVPKAEATQLAKDEKAVKENDDKEINGIRIVYNYQEDRVQIFFRDKSHAQPYCKALRNNAWRWTPSILAWQRKLTNAAKYDADKIAALTP